MNNEHPPWRSYSGKYMYGKNAECRQECIKIIVFDFSHNEQTADKKYSMCFKYIFIMYLIHTNYTLYF